MHLEITQAVEFLGRLLNNKLESQAVTKFKETLTDLLKIRFQEHWDPQQPYRGNAYRAISNFNGLLDPILTAASIQVAIQPITIHAHLPRDFVLWIDPYSVSYRVGDHGNIMTLFETRSGKSTTTTTTSPFIQKRTSTPIRISPPNSPESVLVSPLNKKRDNKGLIMAA